MTFEASRLTVLAITAPQPSWKALAITFRLVPGGPDAMINGLGSLSPSTVIDRVGILVFPSLSQSEKKILRWFRRNFKPHGTKVPSSPRTECDATSSTFHFSLPAVTLATSLFASVPSQI